MKKLFLLTAILIYAMFNAQGATVHWLPPIFTDQEETSAITNNVKVTGINDQHISVSTMSTAPITVTLDVPSDGTFGTKTVVISRDNPGKFIIPAYSYKYLTPDYANLMTPTNRGLRLRSTANFMVNTRLLDHKYIDAGV